MRCNPTGKKVHLEKIFIVQKLQSETSLILHRCCYDSEQFGLNLASVQERFAATQRTGSAARKQGSSSACLHEAFGNTKLLTLNDWYDTVISNKTAKKANLSAQATLKFQ